MLRDGRWDQSTRRWTLEVEDTILNRQATVQTRLVVNAAGVWADQVNQRFRIDTPYKHIMSKGVFLGIRRDPSHQTPLILGGEPDNSLDCFTLIPWGPISLWGPTETMVSTPQEGFSVTAEDIDLLVEQYSEFERLGLDPADVEQKITPRTRAVVVSHLWGMPSKMTELTVLARKHGLRIIEDASHAQGARWRNRLCGTLGDISVFSLQSSKLALPVKAACC